MATSIVTGGLYADTGCEYSPKCVDCPLQFCKYDREPTQAEKEQYRDRGKTERRNTYTPKGGE